MVIGSNLIVLLDSAMRARPQDKLNMIIFVYDERQREFKSEMKWILHFWKAENICIWSNERMTLNFLSVQSFYYCTWGWSQKNYYMI